MPLVSSQTDFALETEFTLGAAGARLEAHDPNGCGSGREIVLEDGAKKCRNCADCPKVAAEVIANSTLNSRRESESDSDVHFAPKVVIGIEE